MRMTGKSTIMDLLEKLQMIKQRIMMMEMKNNRFAFYIFYKTDHIDQLSPSPHETTIIITNGPNLKKSMNAVIANNFLTKFNQQAEESPFQGEFINLMQQEKINTTWKSYIYSVPRGVMSLA